jgi:hypothetical protein
MAETQCPCQISRPGVVAGTCAGLIERQTIKLPELPLSRLPRPPHRGPRGTTQAETQLTAVQATDADCAVSTCRLLRPPALFTYEILCLATASRKIVPSYTSPGNRADRAPSARTVRAELLPTPNARPGSEPKPLTAS